MSAPWRLAVITASVRAGRRGDAVTRWFVDQLDEDLRADVDVIDLAHLRLPDDLGGGGDTAELRARIDRADALVVVTPEYNRGYPGALKTAIDTVTTEWHAKPVGFVAYGGVSGGLRAVEQLRPVLAALHAVPVQAVVSLPYVWESIDDGVVHAPRAESAAATLLSQLAWWATALREARGAAPYLV